MFKAQLDGLQVVIHKVGGLMLWISLRGRWWRELRRLIARNRQSGGAGVQQIWRPKSMGYQVRGEPRAICECIEVGGNVLRLTRVPRYGDRTLTAAIDSSPANGNPSESCTHILPVTRTGRSAYLGMPTPTGNSGCRTGPNPSRNRMLRNRY